MQNVLSLPAELTIYTISELRQQWLGWLGVDAQHDDVLRVDGAAVDEVDAAGVQLLVSFSQTLASRQRSLCLEHPSARLADACAALGVHSLVAAAPGPGAST